MFWRVPFWRLEMPRKGVGQGVGDGPPVAPEPEIEPSPLYPPTRVT